jgi:hypothetical protein
MVPDNWYPHLTSEGIKMKVVSCTVSPSSIPLGQKANLIVELDQPAPAGGYTVAITTNSNGALETLENTPVGLDFAVDDKRFTYQLVTQNVPGAATIITFYAETRSATLSIT